MNNGSTAATKIGRFQTACQCSRAFNCSEVNGAADAAIAVRFAIRDTFPAAAPWVAATVCGPPTWTLRHPLIPTRAQARHRRGRRVQGAWASRSEHLAITKPESWARLAGVAATLLLRISRGREQSAAGFPRRRKSRTTARRRRRSGPRVSRGWVSAGRPAPPRVVRRGPATTRCARARAGWFTPKQPR
jgi:hypothetical protein